MPTILRYVKMRMHRFAGFVGEGVNFSHQSCTKFRVGGINCLWWGNWRDSIFEWVNCIGERFFVGGISGM